MQTTPASKAIAIEQRGEAVLGIRPDLVGRMIIVMFRATDQQRAEVEITQKRISAHAITWTMIRVEFAVV